MDIPLTEIVLATGAVGTAAMGIVEGFKTTLWKPIGFAKLKQELTWAEEALEAAYGENYGTILSSLFRSSRGSGQLPRILRQGVRIGLNADNAENMARSIGTGDPKDLKTVATELAEGEDISKDTTKRNILGRFEMTVDARIDAALAIADRAYKNGLRMRAFGVSIVLSMTAGYLMYEPTKSDAGFLSSQTFILALIVGLTAVPMAPIAKDVAKGLQSASKALGARK